MVSAAHVAAELKDSGLAAHSFELGLALGGDINEAGALMRLYIATKDTAAAHSLALKTRSALPADAVSHTKYAQMVDEAGFRDESIAAWKDVLAMQPNDDHGHVRLSNLILDSGDAKGAEAAADEGLRLAPKSGDLYLAKSDAVSKQGRRYEALAILEQGAAETADVAVISHLASTLETYGDRGPQAYAELAKAPGMSAPVRLQALERGFTVSLRDGNLALAESFVKALEAQGHPEYRTLLGGNRQVQSDSFVPGGLEALAFVARIKNVAPERFFAEYARQVVLSACPDCTGDEFTSRIQNYFQTITQLENIGKRNGNRTVITVSLGSKDERKHAEDVLRLLGIQLHTEKGNSRLTAERSRARPRNKICFRPKAFSFQFDRVAGDCSATSHYCDERWRPSQHSWRHPSPRPRLQPYSAGFVCSLRGVRQAREQRHGRTSR
jgi:tetratricopeptide (TPR) repeat protein